MGKKCLYCGCEVSDDSVIDFCDRCGVKVFGDKLLNAIKQNMGQARDKGDLYQGSVGLDTSKTDSTKSL